MIEWTCKISVDAKKMVATKNGSICVNFSTFFSARFPPHSFVCLLADKLQKAIRDKIDRLLIKLHEIFISIHSFFFFASRWFFSSSIFILFFFGSHFVNSECDTQIENMRPRLMFRQSSFVTFFGSFFSLHFESKTKLWKRKAKLKTMFSSQCFC